MIMIDLDRGFILETKANTCIHVFDQITTTSPAVRNVRKLPGIVNREDSPL